MSEPSFYPEGGQPKALDTSHKCLEKIVGNLYDLVQNGGGGGGGGGSGSAGFAIVSTGLSITIGAGKITDANGASVNVPAGGLSLRASQTQYIMVDLFDLSYHVFNRPWHSAAVCIATIVTDGSSITSLSQAGSYIVPQNAMAVINTRLRAGGNTIRFRITGDSYTYGAGNPVGGLYYWFDLIFNSAAAAYGYNLPSIANVVSTRYGAPGATAIHGMAMIADVTSTPPITGISGHDNVDQVVMRYPLWNMMRASPDVNYGPNAVVAATPDVIILEYGTNYDVKNVEWIEAQIRFWRSKHVATIVMSPIMAYNGAATGTATDTRIKAICDASGASFADANAFIDEAWYNFLNYGGPNPYSDLVHPSVTGQPLVARSITGLFSTVYQRQFSELPSGKPVAATTIRSAPHAHILVNPTVISGTGTGTTLTPSVNFRVLYGGQAAADGFITVTGAQYVTVGYDLCCGDIFAIFENQGGENFSWNCTQQAAPVISSGSVVGASIPFQIVRVMTAAQTQAFPATGSNFPTGYAGGMPVPAGFRFNVSAGTAKLVGFLFESPYVTEIPVNQLAPPSLGVWASENSDLENGSSPICYCTDTLNANVTVLADDCDGISVMLRAGPAAGQIRFAVDGLAQFGPLDLYSSAEVVYHFTTVPGVWPNYAGSTPGVRPLANFRGDHVLQMRHMGANASCVAGTAAKRRLTIEQVRKFKMSLP